MMTKNEIIFYVSVAIATFINSFSFAPCTLAPSLFIVALIGLKAFPPREKQ